MKGGSLPGWYDMGMMIVCLRELGGGEGRSDLCRLLLGKLENPFFQVTCVTD